MQVTTCHPAGVADIADDLPRLHLLAGGDADGRAMSVQRFQPAAVVDLDIIAVAAAPVVKTMLMVEILLIINRYKMENLKTK